MKLFEDKNASLSLAVVVNAFGEDYDMVNNITTGLSKGVFEVTSHGWNHVSYKNLSASEQQNTLSNSSRLLEEIFGKKPTVFVPPFNDYNNDTFKTMKSLGMNSMSAELTSNGPDREQVFVSKKGVNPISVNGSGIFHLPQTIGFNQHFGGPPTKIQLSEIVFEINKAITKYGYGVVVLHPSDFVIDENAERPVLDQKEMNDLASLIDMFRSQGRTIATFQQVLDFPNSTSPRP